MSSAEVVEEEANAQVVEEVAQAAQAIHNFLQPTDFCNPFYTLSTFFCTLSFALNLIGRLQDDLNSDSLSESTQAQVQALLSKYATRC